MPITSRRCFMCGKSTNVEYKTEEYRAWKDGALIQDAFPNMSAEDREVLISGIDPVCFAELEFGEDE